MSVSDWKSFVYTAIRREAFLELQVKLSLNKKTNHITYQLFKTSDYLVQLPPTLARIVFKAKTRMFDLAMNFKNKYKDLRCPFCLECNDQSIN